jgi:general secretion pathway protein D
MPIINRLARIIAITLVLVVAGSRVAAKSDARSDKKVDRYMTEGMQAEQLQQWDRALALYQQSLAKNPGELSRRMAVQRARFQAAQMHVNKGQKLRQEGKLEEALAEFQRAFAIDMSLSITIDEVRRTKTMIEQDKQRKSTPEDRGLTPQERERKAVEERIATTQGAPELRPISRQPITLRMNNQPPRVVFETVGKLAGINVIMDPDFLTMGAPRPISVELNNTTLEEALDYVAILTKCFWKPLSANTILVTQDNPTKRRDHEDQVVKVFYLSNISTAQDLNEVASNVRGITDIRRVFVCASQYAIIVRGEVDKVALAEKLIRDMDKPKSEVVVDILVMQTSRTKKQEITAALVNSSGTVGLSLPISFSPRNGTTTTTSSSSSSSSSSASTSTTTTTLASLGKIASSDFSVTLPDALLELILSDSTTRILQSPQVRALDGQKASLHIGEKQPYSTGGVSTNTTTSGTTGMYTSFQYIDVGVNVDLTPKIHADNEVSLHIEVEISSVKERIEVAGVSEPVIGSSKLVHDIRLHEGEVNLLGGLTQLQRTKSVSGIPGLSSIPILKRLFTSDTTQDTDSDLMIALIPHIIRSPDITEGNLKEIATGSDSVFRLRHAPKSAPASEKSPAMVTVPAAPVSDKLPMPPAPSVTTPNRLPAPPAPPAAPQGPAKLFFAPATVEAQAGTEISLRLDVANAPDLFAAPLRIRFDPKILRLVEAGKGNLLESDGQQLLFTRNIRNDAGEATITITRLPGTGGITASGPLLFLHFQTVGRGTTQVEVPEISATDSKMQPVVLTPPQAVVSIK